MHTRAHCVEHSKINAVRTTMIPLHYLHTGPPSCACLPHCPPLLLCVEVVITKANNSFSLCLRLPSASPSFLFLYAVLLSVLPASRQLVSLCKVCHCGWQLQHESVCVCCVVCLQRIMRLFGAQLMCNKDTVWYLSLTSVIWVKCSYGHIETLDVELRYLLHSTLLV